MEISSAGNLRYRAVVLIWCRRYLLYGTSTYIPGATVCASVVLIV